MSGAEQFTFDLKALKRATIVGKRTHPGVSNRIDDHFGIAIPEVRATNPFGKGDWEEVGMEPDVKVAAVEALVTAERLAGKRRP